MNARAPRTPATKAIAAAIGLGFVIEILTGAWQDPYQLAVRGAIVPEWILEDGQWWRLVSAMFLHGDGTIRGTLLHLAMNLFALFQLGKLYEVMFGSRRFTMIYFATGVAASLTSLWRLHAAGGGSSVGASGAIFGILGAFVFSVYRSPIYRTEKSARNLVSQCIFWIVANIAIASQIPQIDNAAHIGGLVAGLILGAAIPHRVPQPRPSESVIDVPPLQ